MVNRKETEDVDILSQQMQELKRELARLTLSERNYLIEIESLQATLDKEKKEWQQKVTALENGKQNTKESLEKIINEQRALLDAKCEELKTILDKVEASSKDQSDTTTEVEELNQNIHELDSEVGNLRNQYDDMREAFITLEEDTHLYEESINNLKEDHNILKEKYEHKLSDLTESTKLTETLQEELLKLKSELDVLKNKPESVPTTGNSLFAEVDKGRAHLKAKINEMKIYYDEMKCQVLKLEDRVCKMRSENSQLNQNCEKEVKERHDDNYTIENGYKYRIEVLKSLNKEYQNELNSRPVISTKTTFIEELAFLEHTIEMKKKDIDKLRDKYSSNSLTSSITCDQNRDLQTEITTLKLKLMKIVDDVEDKKFEIERLEEEIENMKLRSEKITEYETSPKLISCLKPTNSNDKTVIERNIDLSRLKKRSVQMDNNRNKTVQFSVDTKDDEPNRINIRRGRVVVVEPTVLQKREF